MCTSLWHAADGQPGTSSSIWPAPAADHVCALLRSVAHKSRKSSLFSSALDFDLSQVGLTRLGRDKLVHNLLALVFEKNRPVGRVHEKFQNLLRFSAEELSACFEFKFNLFGDLLCSAAIRKLATGWNVSQFHRGVLWLERRV